MYVPKTLDQIEEVIKRVWSLLREERIQEGITCHEAERKKTNQA